MPYLSRQVLGEHERYVRALEDERDQLQRTVEQQTATIFNLQQDAEAVKLDFQTIRTHLYGALPALGYLQPAGAVNLANDPKSFGQALAVLVQAARHQAAREARGSA